MGLRTQDPYIQKEHTELYKILKFRVNWANIEQDTAIQKLQNLQRNVWISGQVSGKKSSVCSFCLYGSCVLNPIIHGLIPRPSWYEIRQCLEEQRH